MSRHNRSTKKANKPQLKAVPKGAATDKPPLVDGRVELIQIPAVKLICPCGTFTDVTDPRLLEALKSGTEIQTPCPQCKRTVRYAARQRRIDPVHVMPSWAMLQKLRQN